MRKIAVINQKGGVGKTTTVANLGSAVASLGHDVCLIDMDPQSHLTLHLGIEPDTPSHSIYDVLTDKQPIHSAAIMVTSKLWLVPSSIDLAGAEVELVSTVGREQILRDRLADEALPHEFAMIDCPPSLGLLTLNALAAADEVLIPLQPHFLALQGLGKLLQTISLVQKRINPRLKVSGVLLCMFESTTRLAGEVLSDLRQFFEAARGTDTPWANATIFQTMIRRNIKLAECPSHGLTIFDYEPNCAGAQDYTALAKEFLATGELGQYAAEPAPETKAQDVPTESPESLERSAGAGGSARPDEPASLTSDEATVSSDPPTRASSGPQQP